MGPVCGQIDHLQYRCAILDIFFLFFVMLLLNCPRWIFGGKRNILSLSFLLDAAVEGGFPAHIFHEIEEDQLK